MTCAWQETLFLEADMLTSESAVEFALSVRRDNAQNEIVNELWRDYVEVLFTYNANRISEVIAEGW